MQTDILDNLRDALFVRAYDQAVSEYGSWKTYKLQQWLSFLKFGKDDLMDLSMALLSGNRRKSYPLAALDLASYTLAKFGLDSVLAKYPVEGFVFNQRTSQNDPFQLFELKIRFGIFVRTRLHFTPHLLARSSVLTGVTAESYSGNLIADGIGPHDIAAFTQREIERLVDGTCPYECEAERLCRIDSNSLRLAKEFFFEEKWPSSEVLGEIEFEESLLKMMIPGKKPENEQP